MNYAIILAGGYGIRFNSGNLPKQFVEMTGMPMLAYSMKTAQRNANIDEVCVVTLEEYIPQVWVWGQRYHISKLKYVAKAGVTRFDSVYSGMCTIPAKETDAVTASDDGVMADQTLQKEKLFVQQGPQTYRYGVLKTAHETYRSAPQTREVYEDSELVLRLGIPVAMVEGDRFCIKVTYPEDLAIAKALYPLFCEKENRWE